MIHVAALLALLAADEPGKGNWRDDNRCGANAVKVFIDLHGGLPLDDEVDDALPSRPEGNSLEELRMASMQSGVRAEAVKLTFDGLLSGKASLPCIAHVQEQRGHFVVVVACDSKGVTVADPTSLTVATMSHAEFARSWSGWLLVAEPTAFRSVCWAMSGFLLACFVVGLFYRRTAAALLLAVIAAGCGKGKSAPAETMREFRQYPVVIEVARSGGAPISKERWRTVVEKLRPTVRIGSISELAHFAVVWRRPSAVDYAYSHGAELNGAKMFEILVSGQSHPLFGVDWRTTPFLSIGVDGRPRFARLGDGAEAHADQLLSVFAELDVPQYAAVIRVERATTVRSLVDTAAYDFDLTGETPWTVEALARYAPTSDRWINRFGRQVSFDRCAEELLRRPLGEGACSGTHDLIAVAVLLQVNDVTRILSPAVRNACRQRLATATDALRRRQFPDGSWGPAWAQPAKEDGDLATERLIFSERGQRVQATSHHLEWQLRSPADCRLDASALDRAASWGVEELERVPATVLCKSICPYAHLFRAVRDWYGLGMAEDER